MRASRSSRADRISRRSTAAALDVPPALLEAPLGSDEPIEVLPGRFDDAWTVYRWLVGEFPTEVLGDQRDLAVSYFRSDQVEEVVDLYRQHHTALHSYLLQRSQNPGSGGEQRQLSLLAGARIGMHRGDLWLPPVPDDVRDELRGSLLAWGYREDPPGQLVNVGPSAARQANSVMGAHHEGLGVQAVRLHRTGRRQAPPTRAAVPQAAPR